MKGKGRYETTGWLTGTGEGKSRDEGKGREGYETAGVADRYKGGESRKGKGDMKVRERYETRG